MNQTTGLFSESQQSIIKVEKPAKRDIAIIRFLICLGFLSMTWFIAWFCNEEHVGFAPAFWLLSFALFFKLIKMVHEWYHYWSVSVPEAPPLTKKYTVDILTTACPGEPKDMIIRTLKAMLTVEYPHTNYLCDEGDDPELRDFCLRNGIVHVTRTDKTNAKAGNINNALKQASGEICVVLDPDHVPVPQFLDRVLPYFADPKIGFVQCVQGYANQEESLIARGAAEQTYHFYGPMMMCMNSYGTVQAIGANCTFRREALDSIGGHAAGLSEDMHTAMQLHAKGWQSVYVPEMLTKGLVPATLSSYYKQQLKWSRGTFELLFRTYPKLFKNFTWRQKLHYFTIPLYFLFGLINLIDITIPLAALSLAETPWQIDLSLFALYFLPLCGLSMVIRLYAQRWLLEEHEKGFHIAGGLLRLATWWIFLIGFIYTIFKVKVPYIPTPKEDEHQNYWRLSMPNFITGMICVVAVVYGLSIDWTPYSMAMAFYALLNGGMLLLVGLLSQQKSVMQVNFFLKHQPVYQYALSGMSFAGHRLSRMMYGVIRSGPLLMLLSVSLMFLSYSAVEEEETVPGTENHVKEMGGFFAGVCVDSIDAPASDFKDQDHFALFSFPVKWNDSFFTSATGATFQNKMPLIKWNLQLPGDSLLRFYAALRDKKLDGYLKERASELRAYREPVMLSFVSEASPSPGESAEEAAEAWQYIYTFFTRSGVSNVTWVWPLKTGAEAYPGPKFVDWIGVDALNYGSSTGNEDWFEFTQLYEPLGQKITEFGKPVFLTSLGCVNGKDQKNWFSGAFAAIRETKQIKGFSIYCGQKKFNILSAGDTLLYVSDFSLQRFVADRIDSTLQSSAPFSDHPFSTTLSYAGFPQKATRSGKIIGSAGHYSFVPAADPFYMKGVSYNTAHDWRDGNVPLTRRQVEKDMQRMKEMGANTVRRYNQGIYDRNVLNIASEYQMNVLYGFWFDPATDFYSDTDRVREYIEEIEETVLQFRDHDAVLAWSLGNETWGQLKHHFAKPYLTQVRNAYVKMIEMVARRIHELDPKRAVFTCIEHEEYQLPGELAAFADGAPSVDAVGINSYYREQISRLNHVFWQFDSTRPYLVSEFGPRGYWDPAYNRAGTDHRLIEDSETEKAEWYRQQWRDYIVPFKGYNIGGFAYCWLDRMEGSYTWFGLTDYRSRLKPAYYALKEEWTKKTTPVLPTFSISLPHHIKAGERCVVKATGSHVEGLNYEWFLLKDDYLKKTDVLGMVDGGRSVTMEVPDKNANYRLYLYVSDENGNVTTASAPVQIH